MAKSKECQIWTEQCNEALTAQQEAYLYNVESILSTLIPDPSEGGNYLGARKARGKKLIPKAQKAHKEAWDSLIQYAMENGALSQYRIEPEWFFDGMRDLLTTKFGGVASPLSLAKTPQKMIDTNNYIQSLLKKMTELSEDAPSERWIDRLAEGFTPAAFGSMTKERFGILRRFQEIAGSFTESKRSLAFQYLNTLGDAANDFDVRFNEILTNKDVTEDMTMGGIHVYTSSKAIPSVLFLGTVERGGKKVHLAKVNGVASYLPYEDISTEEIKRSLKRMYRDELTDELRNGDTRYIKWSTPASDISKSELGQVNYILYQMGRKKELAETEVMPPEGEGRVHTFEKGNYRIKVVFTKDKNTPYGKKEVYNARIISHEDMRVPEDKREIVTYFSSKGKSKFGKGFDSSKLLKVEDVFADQDGYYKASEWQSFGQSINKKTGMPIPFSNDRQPINFERMKMQPHPEIMGDAIAGTRGISIWEYNSEIKNLLADFADNIIVPMSKQNSKRISDAQKILESSPQIAELLGAKPGTGLTEGEFTLLEQVMNHHQVRNRLHVARETDDSGNTTVSIRTRNTFFNRKSDYSPWMWEDNVVMDMAVDAIAEMEARYNEIDNPTPEETELYEEQKEALESVVEIASNEAANNLEHDSKTVVGSQAAYTKHRKAWTNPQLRRKDNEVLTDYVDKVLYNLQQESLYATALESLVALASTSQGRDMDLFTTQTKWVMNQMKKALNDPSHYASFPLPFGKELDYSHKAVAKFLNDIGMKNELDREWDEISAQRMILRWRGITAAALLGAPSAAVNRTQTINTIITRGWDTSQKAWKAMKDNTSYADDEFAGVDWDLVVEETGTDQLVTAFADAVADENDISNADMGFHVFWQVLPGGKFVPAAAMRRFMSLLYRGKEGIKAFVDKGDPEIDQWLRELEARRVSKYYQYKDIIKNSDDKKSVKNAIKILEVIDAEFDSEKVYTKKRSKEELRKLFIKMLTSDNSNEDGTQNRAHIEKQIKNLLGQLSKERLQKMVAFKLSYFWNFKSTRGLLTFTEGERIMRHHGVISALIDAYYSGHLGQLGKKIQVNRINPTTGEEEVSTTYEVFRTRAAKRVARMAVRNEYFGMTKVHMGEAMGGFGEGLWTYKGYPIQQMIADHRILTSMMAESKIGAMSRISNELSLMISEWAQNRAITGRIMEGLGYETEDVTNPNNPDGDPQARAVIRLLLTRGMMSVAMAIMDIAPYFKYASTQYMAARHVMRGAENPLFKMAITILVNGIMMAGSDDDEKVRRGVSGLAEDMIRLFIPLWISLPLTSFYRTGKAVSKAFD